MTVDVFKRLQEYVGREYRVGTYDCAHLAADVQAELFGRDVALPGVHPGGVAGQRAAINAMRDELAVQIQVPIPGCAVLLSEGSVLHIGTVALRHDQVLVLHNSAKMGSAQFDPLEDLLRFGMKFEGYYAWK